MELQNDDYDNVPLTKSKNKKEELTKIVQEYVEKPEPEKKPRPPKSEKQLESMKKALEVRRGNIEKRKYDKKVAASKFLVEHEARQDEAINKPQPKPKKQIIVHEERDESSDSEPEIVFIKKPKKSKRNKIIVQESDSESESDEEPIQKQFGKSHQNKKSVVKTYEQPKPTPKQQPNISYRNMFTD